MKALGIDERELALLVEHSYSYVSRIMRGKVGLQSTIFYKTCEILEILPSTITRHAEIVAPHLKRMHSYKNSGLFVSLYRHFVLRYYSTILHARLSTELGVALRENDIHRYYESEGIVKDARLSQILHPADDPENQK